MPTRRDCLAGIFAAIAGLGGARTAFGQVIWGVAWTRVPTITTLSAPNDSRLPLVNDAVAFWNRTFGELGSGFRLGPVTETIGTIPAAELAQLSELTLARAGPVPPPDGVKATSGDIIVALSEGNFISFARRWPPLTKALVAIKSDRFSPLSMPNVARNVIAHELGHAIGLGHNSDPSLLMCGRPAPCRPDLFASSEARYFPLSEAEKGLLLGVYPADWRAL